MTSNTRTRPEPEPPDATRNDKAEVRIPEALARRLWRPVIRLPGRAATGIIFGPGWPSALEACAWLDAKTGARTLKANRSSAATKRRWKERGTEMILSVEIPVLDHGADARRKIQRDVRRAALKAATQREDGHSPKDINDVIDLVRQTSQQDIRKLAALAGPGVSAKRLSMKDAEIAAACTLAGAGQRMRKTLTAARAPRRWHPKAIRNLTAQRTIPWSAAAAAGVLDWRDARGAWPRAGDDVGDWRDERRRRRRRDHTQATG